MPVTKIRTKAQPVITVLKAQILCNVCSTRTGSKQQVAQSCARGALLCGSSFEITSRRVKKQLCATQIYNASTDMWHGRPAPRHPEQREGSALFVLDNSKADSSPALRDRNDASGAAIRLYNVSFTRGMGVPPMKTQRTLQTTGSWPGGPCHKFPTTPTFSTAGRLKSPTPS